MRIPRGRFAGDLTGESAGNATLTPPKEPTHSLDVLKRRMPQAVDELTWIQNLALNTRAFPYPPFFEPATWLIMEPGKEARFEISADLLAAWISHLSYSARRRMEVYEDEILDALTNDRFLVSASMARCHLEASAWVIYGLEELTEASESLSWSRLALLIPKMLNGSAVASETKHLPEASVDPLWLKPSSVMNAIDAMDRYFNVCNAKNSREARILYAILSDYAHPSMFGARHLFQARDEGHRTGWTIAYGTGETVDEHYSAMIIRSLLTSMRLGHSAALMLRLGTIEERDEGVFNIRPSPADGAAVWESIINGKPEAPET
jgi:hypothetical protein